RQLLPEFLDFLDGALSYRLFHPLLVPDLELGDFRPESTSDFGDLGLLLGGERRGLGITGRLQLLHRNLKRALRFVFFRQGILLPPDSRGRRRLLLFGTGPRPGRAPARYPTGSRSA